MAKKQQKEIWAATGRRKSSVARVRMMAGAGVITINGRVIDEYLRRDTLKMVINQAFEQTKTENQFDVLVNVHGGGLTGQAGAIRHGIARCLEKIDPNHRAPLKAAGMITRDARSKERKKYGQRGARARFQFSKR